MRDAWSDNDEASAVISSRLPHFIAPLTNTRPSSLLRSSIAKACVFGEKHCFRVQTRRKASTSICIRSTFLFQFPSNSLFQFFSEWTNYAKRTEIAKVCKWPAGGQFRRKEELWEKWKAFWRLESMIDSKSFSSFHFFESEALLPGSDHGIIHWRLREKKRRNWMECRKGCQCYLFCNDRRNSLYRKHSSDKDDQDKWMQSRKQVKK